MISFTTGDILDAEADALVNTVNCVGVMGRGIALQFKNAFPDNFKAYAMACERHEVQPGRMFVFDTGRLTPRYIINFPTKRHWRGKSRIEDIDAGLVDLVRVIKSRSIRSIAIPPLGAGLGGLDWTIVRPRIVRALEALDVTTLIYEPSSAPDSAVLARNRKVATMTPARAALIVLMQRYLNGLMDPFVTLLEVHKLLFFMQEAGQDDLRLKYRKANFGPYAENLRHLLHSLEGQLLSGYSDGGDDPNKQLELVPGAYEDANDFLLGDEDVRERFDRVASLVEGFETPYGLELLATVYWTIREEGARTNDEIINAVHQWSDRKRRFTPDQITLATNVLAQRGWVDGDVQVVRGSRPSVEARVAVSN